MSRYYRPNNTRQTRERNKRILAASDVCHICGEPGADAVDHVIPLARGGTDDDDADYVFLWFILTF